MKYLLIALTLIVWLFARNVDAQGLGIVEAKASIVTGPTVSSCANGSCASAPRAILPRATTTRAVAVTRTVERKHILPLLPRRR